MDVSLQLCLQIPLTDIIAYVKLSRAYFGFLEVLFRNHLDVLCGMYVYDYYFYFHHSLNYFTFCNHIFLNIATAIAIIFIILKYNLKYL